MNRSARWLILLTVTGVAVVFTAALIVVVSPRAVAQHPGADSAADEKLVGHSSPSAELEPALAKALATAGRDQRLNIIVEMREQVAPATVLQGRTSGARARQQMVSAMQATAERTQASVRAYLVTRWLTGDVTRVRPFWIFNGLAVNGARPEVVEDLAARSDIALVRLDHRRRWIEEESERGDEGRVIQDLSVEWGVKQIRADEVWGELGVTGSGVVVANLDTGVDWQHPALQAAYRGYNPKGFHQHEGNWFDAIGDGALYPVDGHGHGSHTMGTIVGGGGIGVAPGAQWIAVRAFGSDGFALDSWLHAGFEWVLAPDGDPDLAPQVVNNSWGNNVSALTTFQRDLDALRAGGIFVVFSAGNLGPEQRTISSPASLPGAFAVGASDQDDEVASFSSRGPSPWGEVRPHVVAPGVNVYSTLPGGAYEEKQGTSMAAPHAAGTAALMLSAWPDLTITQTAFILTSTAVPLSDTIPNNITGYGRVDAYAAVALAANAGLISGTVYGAGVPLPDATVQATPVISGPAGSATTDSAGGYQLFLGAGYYDLAASAFGYATAYAHALPVNTGMVTTQDFDLVPLPTGHLEGTVTALGGGPVEATVSVLGTPVATTAEGGHYQLDLPSGQYTLEVRALGYRVVTASVTVTTGQDLLHAFLLPESMRVLLVDSGPWYYQSQIPYYRQTLDDLSYAYDETRLKHVPGDTPALTDLLSYDLVIWSAPSDSPGLVRAGVVLTDYLDSGGNLLVSGQDVGFWDGGGVSAIQPYYFDFLHSVFRVDNAPSRQVICLDDSSFDGIALTIEGEGGADNQNWPDEIGVVDPDHATQVCSYEAGRGAVIQAGFCRSHRALNLGFGFEAINDPADRAEFLTRALDWFASPRQTAGVEMLLQTAPTLVAQPGGVVTHSLRLRNLGEAGAGDVFDIEVEGDAWRTTVLTSTIDLGPCATGQAGVRVEIPTDATWNTFDALTVTARSSVDPGLSQTLIVTSKAPAPVLLVDDDRWFDQEAAYEEVLITADVPYDRWEVTGVFGSGSPSAEVLGWYPIALWFTGYDWFDPIHKNEVDRLTGYLDKGGRLFVSSQDALSYIESEDLTRDYFGVISYSWVLSQTSVQGVPGHVLGDGLGRVDLDYPFRNWSDSILPGPDTEVAFRGQHGQPAALTREGDCSISPSYCRWRSALFTFPVEALPEAVRETLMWRLVGWLSWLGRSSLRSDRAVAQVGDTVGYTLTLRNDGPGTVFGATVSNTLPAEMVLVEGPDGGASYDAQARRITWTGDLAPGEAIVSAYRLNLTSSAGGEPVQNIVDITLGTQGIRFQRQASVQVAAPELSASSLMMFAGGAERLSHDAGDAGQSPETAKSATEVSVIVVVRNDGLGDALDVSVDNPLPWPLRLITETLSSDGVGTATELPWGNRIRWEGDVDVGTQVTLTYRAVAPHLLNDGLWLYNAARLEDGLGGAWERGGWLYVEPYRRYLPIMVRDG